MAGLVIGIDTSCYTTSAAAVTTGGAVVASCRRLLPVRDGERGLRQSEMVLLHTRQLPQVLQELQAALAGSRVEAVCASVRPRDDSASYMPAFQVGDAQARGLAAVLGVPCFSSTHQRGHIRAALLDSGADPAKPLLAVHLSGGTTEVLLMEGERLALLGGTLDLHAGQLIDRAGVAMGLPFPAGPAMEALALQAQAKALLPVSMAENDLCCHLSGAEAQVLRWLNAGQHSPAEIAAEVFDFLARTLGRMLTAASRATGASQALIAGGVASSSLFRALLTDRLARQCRALKPCFGRPEFSGDNAVGVALLGAEALRAQKEEHA